MLTGRGGTLMFMGGPLFFLVLIATALFGQESERPVDVPFTRTHVPPAGAGWEVGLDRFGLWVGAAVLLILIAYGPFLLQYLPGSFTSPGYRFY
jgi:cytochrome c oxidase subunit 1